jgi:tektin-4
VWCGISTVVWESLLARYILLQEAALIAEVGDLMTRQLKQIDEQLWHNKAIKKRLEMDWSDKKEAYEIEAINAGLHNSSKTLLFKPGATRFPDRYRS